MLEVYKRCRQCGTQFSRPSKIADSQWKRQQFCDLRCANTWRAQRQSPDAFGDWGVGKTKRDRVQYRGRMRQRGSIWATSWEDRRRTEEMAELEAAKIIIGRGAQRIRQHQPRQFLGWHCAGCGEPFVYFEKRAQSKFCATCNHVRNRGSASRRARRLGVIYEVVIPKRVFERDGYRCQICGVATRGDFPALTSPTLDHIVPLSRGGSHTYANVQCACFRCNSIVKRDGAANDQLRLEVA